MVTWQYSQKNDGQPPENVHIRPNQRLRNFETKIGRCEWLWKLTPTSIPEMMPSITAEAATKAMRDPAPEMPATFWCRYSQKAQEYAARQVIWKITQFPSWGCAKMPQRLGAAGASRASRLIH